MRGTHEVCAGTRADLPLAALMQGLLHCGSIKHFLGLFFYGL